MEDDQEVAVQIELGHKINLDIMQHESCDSVKLVFKKIHQKNSEADEVFYSYSNTLDTVYVSSILSNIGLPIKYAPSNDFPNIIPFEENKLIFYNKFKLIGIIVVEYDFFSLAKFVDSLNLYFQKVLNR